MYDMTIRLQTNTKTCLYEQIYEHIKQEIKEGRLLRGERLPSTRSLAEYLQISRSTVDYAYEQLLSEGYIEAVPCRGYFVCSIEEVLNLEEAETENLPGEKGKTAPAAQPAQAKVKADIRYDFSPHSLDMTQFPYGIWKKITREVVCEENGELFLPGPAQGDIALRTTIARYLHSSRGVLCTPEQIVIGAGNDYLLLLLEKIFGRKLRIAMENPTYKRAYQIFRSFGYEVVKADMDENGMMVSHLKELEADMVYVMPSHQFPCGTVMPIGRRTELLSWAAEGERCIIEDDYDSEFRYRGKPIPSLQGSDKRDRVIYIGTFSKAIAPAIRISYMVLPPYLLEAYKRNCHFYSCTVSRIDQKILNEFISGGYFERHLNKMRKCYRTKHDILLEALKPLQKGFAIKGEHAGLHILLEAKFQVEEEELIRLAAQQQIAVYGLNTYRMEEESESKSSPKRAVVLLGFGGMSHEEILAGCEGLYRAWKKLIGE